MDYITSWKERIKEDECKRVELLKEARDAAEHASRILIDEFGAERVYLFGSLLTKEDFSICSDIDIAVEGLKVELYFKALSRVWNVLPNGIKLDLVPMEDTDEYLKSKILATGVVLYEKHLTYS